MNNRTICVCICVGAAMADPRLASATYSVPPGTFTGQPSTGFEVVTAETRVSFVAALSVGTDVRLNALVTTGSGTEILRQCASYQTDCVVDSWFSLPVVVTFDGPVAAFAIEPLWCDCGYGIVVTDDLGAATTHNGSCGAGAFVGLSAEAGRSITSVELTGSAGPRCYVAKFDDLRVLPGTAAVPVDADVELTLDPLAVTEVGGGELVTLGIVGSNLGPATASGVTVLHLAPPGVLQPSPAPTDPSGQVATYAPFDLAASTSHASVASFATPDLEAFDCRTRLLDLAIVRTDSNDPVHGNNVLTTPITFDRSTVAAREDCSRSVDADCDGAYGCADADCAFEPSCTPPSLGFFALAPSPPLVPWPPVQLPVQNPAAPGFPPGLGNPYQPPPGYGGADPGPTPDDCYVLVHDLPVLVPSYCCDGDVMANFWNLHACRPHDPNEITSDAATNVHGYGYVHEAQTIRFLVHYENDGGADAHMVEILGVLDPLFDEATLVLENGGSFDPSTRTLRWVDPVVYPHDPRAVAYTVTLRASAGPGARVRSQGTIVFPDAFPPSRVDTNVLEHTIPTAPITPDLSVHGCVPVEGSPGEWHVLLANRGFGFAYNVSATITSPPASVHVAAGTARFAHRADPHPETMATVPPLATSASIDTVRFTADSGKDPCGALTWTINWETSSRQPRTTLSQGVADVDQDAVPDYLEAAAPGDDLARGEPEGGCSCTTSAVSVASVWPLLLAAVALARRGHRREVRR